MDRLNEILKQVGKNKTPPVDQWNPELCGSMDMVIRKDGSWVHEGRVITRQKLVRLFASILKREGTDYFLVTPVEKVQISVENTPFVVVRAEWLEGNWYITNNLDEVQLLSAENAFDLSDEQNPQLNWRANLPARIHQNVMYQWQTHALDEQDTDEDRLVLNSDNQKFVIGQLI